MIEKLKVITQQVGSLYDLGHIKTEQIFATNEQLHNKINELVDAVNELQEQVKEIMTWRFETDDEPAEKPTNSKMENVDPYAEQRKWIGKLCRFWDDDHEEDRIYDILHHIDPNCVYKYARRELGGGYQHCEPVKLDDDIIYKGGKDE